MAQLAKTTWTKPCLPCRDVPVSPLMPWCCFVQAGKNLSIFFVGVAEASGFVSSDLKPGREGIGLVWVSSWITAGTRKGQISPMGGQGNMWCHQWNTDHVTILDKRVTLWVQACPISHHRATKTSLLSFSLHTCLVGCHRKTHPFLTFSPATHTSFRMTFYVMERKEDKSFVIQGTPEMLLRAQRGEGR